MLRRCIAITMGVAGCGEVATRPIDAPLAIDAAPPVDAAQAVVYKGSLAETRPVAFGGTPFCSYTITLKQLAVELTVLRSGDVMSARVQALNVEAKDASCTFDTIPANIATYTLASSSKSGGVTTLTFTGASTNAPQASLVATLSPPGAAFAAALTFRRTDAGDPLLAWEVKTTISLAAQ